MPDELYRHLFLSFIKRPSTSSAVGGADLGGRSNGDVVVTDVHESPSRLHGLLHGLTERLHNLGGSVELSGRRSRAGRPKSLAHYHAAVLLSDNRYTNLYASCRSIVFFRIFRSRLNRTLVRRRSSQRFHDSRCYIRCRSTCHIVLKLLDKIE